MEREKSALILGIGNILLRDEGVGVHVVRALQAMDLPAGVEAMDGGTSGVDLVDEIADRRKLVVIDAATTEGEPGTVLRFGMESLMPADDRPMSLHEFGLLDTLMTAKALNCLPAKVVIIGIQPEDVSPGLELSPKIARLVPKLAELALAECGNP